MNKQDFDVSVVMSTYNRCAMLSVALASLIAQQPGDVRYELIIVDNNSTDRTREVIESFVEQARLAGRSMRYVFEGKQGLSHGWNAGIAAAQSPIIAFTDDDISVAPDWVVEIKRAFDEHPEIDFIGSRVLPRWRVAPPAWLTPAHWAPLALQDFEAGKEIYSNTAEPRCLLGKSFRRAVFDRVGLFAPELGRTGNSLGSMEDHELQQRVWQYGGQGMFAPRVVVHAEVQDERLTKAYHRQWHTGHGGFYAVMRDDELEQSTKRIFDVPGHLYRQAAADLAKWGKAMLGGNFDQAFKHEVSLRSFGGFFRRRVRQYFQRDASAVTKANSNSPADTSRHTTDGEMHAPEQAG